jgi:hypothetical protein
MLYFPKQRLHYRTKFALDILVTRWSREVAVNEHPMPRALVE